MNRYWLVVAVCVVSLASRQSGHAAEDFYSSDRWPAPNAAYASPDQHTLRYQQGTWFQNIELSRFRGAQPVSSNIFTNALSCAVTFTYSGDGGMTWVPATGTVEMMIRATPTGTDGDARLFDLEVLSFQLAGHGPLEGSAIRQDASSQSRGRLRIRAVPGGYMMDSSVDLLTELSILGTPWSPATDALPLTMRALHEVYPFHASTAVLGVQAAGGIPRSFSLAGTSEWRVHTAPDGGAVDSNSDGLDGVFTEMVALDMVGLSPSSGVSLRLNAQAGASTGSLKEASNATAGILDVPPFANTGSAESFFDVFFTIEIDGQTYYGAAPAHLSATIRSIPPLAMETYLLTGPSVLLRDANGNPSELAVAGFSYTPSPATCVAIFCPPNVSVWTCNSDGMQVNFDVNARTHCGSNVSVACEPPSGQHFQPGTNAVLCTARDNNDNSAECRFNVEVLIDNQNPRITCPSNMVVWTCSADGTNVSYVAPPATDDFDTNVVVACTPLPGHFTVGTHVITCVATDDCERRSQCQFEIQVAHDRLGPTVTCPTTMVALTSNSSEPVEYPVAVQDERGEVAQLQCNPPSGASFQLGTTIVTCIASDTCGNSQLCRFEVMVVEHSEPRLTISHLPNGQIRVCWPASASAYRLQSSQSPIEFASWSDVVEAPDVDDTENCVRLQLDAAHRFFRMIRDAAQ